MTSWTTSTSRQDFYLQEELGDGWALRHNAGAQLTQDDVGEKQDTGASHSIWRWDCSTSSTTGAANAMPLPTLPMPMVQDRRSKEWYYSVWQKELGDGRALRRSLLPLPDERPMLDDDAKTPKEPDSQLEPDGVPSPVDDTKPSLAPEKGPATENNLVRAPHGTAPGPASGLSDTVDFDSEMFDLIDKNDGGPDYAWYECKYCTGSKLWRRANKHPRKEDCPGSIYSHVHGKSHKKAVANFMYLGWPRID